MPCSRATRAAAILPSTPRPPNPPGISTPSASRSRSAVRSGSSCSESTQSISTRQPWATAEWRSASTTDMYASSSRTYFPTSAIRTGGSAWSARSVSSRHPSSSGSAASSPKCSRTKSSTPSSEKTSGTL